MKQRVLIVSLLVLALVGIAFDAPLSAQFDKDPGPGGGGGGSCSYCSQPACGCSPPPSMCTLSFNCSCSSVTCIRSCDYDC